MDFRQTIQQFIDDELLPSTYLSSVQQWFIPLYHRLLKNVAAHQNNARTPLFVGINGAQGSGKSTLSSLLCRLFNAHSDYNALCVSIDDFYHTRATRLNLSRSIHPLLVTRGVPGTHDTALMQSTFENVFRGEACQIPVFDKSIDDRASETQWHSVSTKLDLIILEGWCVASPAQKPEHLKKPVNTLEAEEDPDAKWRSYVNEKLANEYHSIFASIDHLIMLKAPSFAQIYKWRCEQEHKMQTKNKQAGLEPGGMSDAEIKRFIQHYQRITEHGLKELPALCQDVFILNEHRSIVECLQP
uniref:kinase n=1 Tax=Ningiella ruwaisensis TaxID=2364274 RepID=UPI001F4F3C26|nr:kinase [Ningiella ruwaisensis]